MNRDGLIIDNFAGGGGASVGIERAVGRHVDIAINHDRHAIAMHAANHPSTRHYCEDVWNVDPREAVGRNDVLMAHFSPDCKHFSKARGATPLSKKIRGLAWVALRWAALTRPRLITLENVEEFQTWGPLTRKRGRENHPQPCKRRRFETFLRWCDQLRGIGYELDWRELKACDYGSPTIRKRLYIAARCDGLPVEFPEVTHGERSRIADQPLLYTGMRPWRTAAECIDWSIECPSIFGRKRPLAENTLKRIAHGMKRFVIDAAEPFIVNLTHRGSDRVESFADPFKTITGAHRGEKAVCIPTLVQTGYGEREGQAPRVPGLGKPLGTVVAGGGKHALVAAFLAKHFGGMVGIGINTPLPTTTTRGTQNQIVTSHLLKLYGTCKDGAPVGQPMPTVTAGSNHIAEVRAFLVKFFGSCRDGQSLNDPMHTVTTHDRLGLVTISGEDYQIVDIGMRMLTPRELYRAQGFDDSYIINPAVDGKPLTKTQQVKMCGNSVCPDVEEALVRANLPAVLAEAS